MTPPRLNAAAIFIKYSAPLKPCAGSFAFVLWAPVAALSLPQTVFLILYVVLQDTYERTIQYLRLSVTDRCQARCIYCMPERAVDWMARAEILSFEELITLITLLAELGIEKVRVTGGEPLVRRGVIPFIGALTGIAGIKKVALTTNAILLAPYLKPLFDAGLRSVNISLDSLDGERGRLITRTDTLRQTLRGFYAAVDAGFQVKLNCVPVSGYNDDDIIPIARLAEDRDIAVRFIELMPLGAASALKPIPTGAVKAALERAFGPLVRDERVSGEGPAEYYRAAGFHGVIGFISPLSHLFCARCNRLRLNAAGLLRPCLASADSVDLKTPLRNGAEDRIIQRLIQDAVRRKAPSHQFAADNAVDDGRYKRHKMYTIGG